MNKMILGILGFVMILSFGISESFAEPLDNWITTDKKSYIPGEIIIVNGQVFNRSEISLSIFGHNGDMMGVLFVKINTDKSFSLEINTDGPLWKNEGIYTLYTSIHNLKTTIAIDCTPEPNKCIIKPDNKINNNVIKTDDKINNNVIIKTQINNTISKINIELVDESIIENNTVSKLNEELIIKNVITSKQINSQNYKVESIPKVITIDPVNLEPKKEINKLEPIYIPEPRPQCGNGTELVNGYCKVVIKVIITPTDNNLINWFIELLS